MKRLFGLLVITCNLLFANSYIFDKSNSNTYFKANADLLFFGSDEIVGINKNIKSSLKIRENRLSGEVLIEAGSFNTQNQKRDEHIKEILNYKTYPYIKFKILEETDNQDKQNLQGVLTINGIRKDINIPVKKELSNQYISYKGNIKIKYKEFGIEPPTLGFIKQAEEFLEIGAKLNFKKDL